MAAGGIREEIRDELLGMRDEEYRDFMSWLIPNVDPETVIGIRTPALRELSRKLGKREDIGEFLGDLPHRYFEENQLHAFILSGIKDFGTCIDGVSRFLPYVDNWATCDQMSPKVFGKNRPELLIRIRKWISSPHTYTVRFALGMLMEHFLDGDFDPAYPEMAVSVRSDEYYVNMMIAWYFATALAKQYDAVIPYIEERRLDRWTHNKAIQKSVESRRITPEQKEYLRSLRARA